MSTLQIQLAQDADAGRFNGVAIPLDVIDQKFERVRNSPETADIWQLRQGYDIDVEPGSYLVRAYLPSGETLSAQANVSNVGRSQVVLTPRRLSPREDDSLLYYMTSGAPLDTSPGDDPLPDWTGGPEEPVDGEVSVEFWREFPGPDWKLDAYNEVGATDYDVKHLAKGVVRAFNIAYTNANMPFWARISAHDSPSKFVSLPPCENGGRMYITRAEPSDKGDRLSVFVENGAPRSQALLGYLSAGDFGSALRISDSVVQEAEKALEDKLHSPASAVIASYYLLSIGKLERLHDWAGNLNAWFPGMPDGAIIDAWQELYAETTNVAKARSALVEAARRGVPFYTRGLRLLFDGLNLISRSEEYGDVAAKAALETVRPYAAAADWTATTTTFYGTNPKEPTPVSRLLTPDTSDYAVTAGGGEGSSVTAVGSPSVWR
jgi:hypothetical protein